MAATQSLTPSMDLLCLTPLRQFLSGTIGTIGKSTVMQLLYSWFIYGDITVVSLMSREGCLQYEGVHNPFMSAIQKAISKEELVHHCRRRTRGAEITLQLIEELVLESSSFPTAVDSNGVYVFSGDMVKILNEEKKHIKRIQDPDRIRFNIVMGHIIKGGMKLPVFRCARGTTSLESFHLHLAR